MVNSGHKAPQEYMAAPERDSGGSATPSGPGQTRRPCPAGPRHRTTIACDLDLRSDVARATKVPRAVHSWATTRMDKKGAQDIMSPRPDTTTLLLRLIPLYQAAGPSGGVGQERRWVFAQDIPESEGMQFEPCLCDQSHTGEPRRLSTG